MRFQRSMADSAQPSTLNSSFQGTAQASSIVWAPWPLLILRRWSRGVVESSASLSESYNIHPLTISRHCLRERAVRPARWRS